MPDSEITYNPIGGKFLGPAAKLLIEASYDAKLPSGRKLYPFSRTRLLNYFEGAINTWLRDGIKLGAFHKGKLIGLCAGVNLSDFKKYASDENKGIIARFILPHLEKSGFPKGRNVAYLTALAVAPRWQKKGIGRGLNDHLINELKNEGFAAGVLQYVDGSPTGRIIGIDEARSGWSKVHTLKHDGTTWHWVARKF